MFPEIHAIDEPMQVIRVQVQKLGCLSKIATRLVKSLKDKFPLRLVNRLVIANGAGFHNLLRFQESFWQIFRPDVL
jgi:hypothetical protein